MESPEQLEFQEVPQEVQQMFFSEYLGRSVQVKARNELYSRFVSLPEFYLDHMGTVKDFEVRDDDIWIVTYPKCGTTFASEMIWLLSSDLDYKQAETVKLVGRITHIEFPVSRKCNIKQFICDLKDKAGPRVIRTHLPLSLLPSGLLKSKAKIIYVTRDPKDASISLFHHMKEFNRCTMSLDDFLNGFLRGELIYGSMFDHISEFWSEKRQNMKFIRFEDMKSNLGSVVSEMSSFLGKHYSKDQLDVLVEHLQFDKMKNNPSVNLNELTQISENRFNCKNVGQFMRKGQIDSYKDEMSEDWIIRFDERIADWECKEILNKP